MPDPTTNYSWDLPNVGGDSGSWGTLLNTILNDIDDKLFTADAVADAALPVAGGTMTGNLKTKTTTETVGSVSGGSGTKTIDLSAANFYYTGSLSGAVTFDFTNGPATGTAVFIILEVVNGGAASSISYKWGGSARTPKWQDGTAPTLIASGKDILVFYTRDGGTTIIGAHAISDPT